MHDTTEYMEPVETAETLISKHAWKMHALRAKHGYLFQCVSRRAIAKGLSIAVTNYKIQYTVLLKVKNVEEEKHKEKTEKREKVVMHAWGFQLAT